MTVINCVRARRAVRLSDHHGGDHRPVRRAVLPVPARGLDLGPAPPVPVSHEDASFVAPAAGMADGDEDHTFDSASPSTLARGSGPPGPAARPANDNAIAPLEAAYLCTYQSLRRSGRPNASHS